MTAKHGWRLATVLVFGLALAALPFAVSTDGVSDQPAFAKNNGNGGKGGKGGNNGNGGGHGAGGSKGAGQNSGKSASAGNPSADAPGQAKQSTAVAAGSAMETGDGAYAAPHPSDLGRLNAVMNASSQALANAAPGSAIGVVAQAYREALSAYAAGLADDTADDDDTAEPDDSTDAALEAAAEAFALAANKEVTADVVAAVNARLAATYADDPNLAGLEDPDSPESQALAESIAAAAESYQEQETDQGLGGGLDAGDDGDDGDEVADGGTETEAGDDTVVQ